MKKPSSQIKSRERVALSGEVFTAPREVKAMLDLVRKESFSIDATFLESSFGNGNFLVEIFRRKLKTARTLLREREREREESSPSDTLEEASLLIHVRVALSTYGIELQQDNVEEARARCLSEFRKSLKRSLKRDMSPEEEALIAGILKANLVQGDALSFKDVAGKDVSLFQWSLGEDGTLEGRGIRYQDMVEGAPERDLFNNEQFDVEGEWVPPEPRHIGPVPLREAFQ